ncbi:MAG: MoaD/ThiS family protein [Firmicutes bacterium]|nr:MoaD/ThiS family protein [Bacillota bacterium]
MRVTFEMNQATLTATDTIELEEGTTVIEGFKVFVKPYLEKGCIYQEEQAFVVNNRMAEEDDVIHDGDKVMIFPVMAGG